MQRLLRPELGPDKEVRWKLLRSQASQAVIQSVNANQNMITYDQDQLTVESDEKERDLSLLPS